MDTENYYVGKSVALSLSDIVDPFGIAIVAPVVTMVIRLPSGETEDLDVTGVVAPYTAIFTPDTPGQHIAIVSATSGDTAWKGRFPFFVEAV